jgi:hypothetical protein
MYIIQYHTIIYIYVCVGLFLTNTSESYMANPEHLVASRVTSTATWNVPRAATPIPGMAPEAGPAVVTVSGLWMA